MDFVSLREKLNELDPKTWTKVRKAAKAGDSEAQFLLGYRLNWANLSHRDCEKWLRASADQNHAEATYMLAGRLGDGPEGRDLLLRAAELGSTEAQRDLAVCYVWGEDGYEQNWNRCRFWYRQAALGGHCEAMVACGSMMVRGDGGETRRAEGLAFLEAAANGPDRECAESAMDQLARIYSGSFGLEPDTKLAAVWTRRLEQYRGEVGVDEYLEA